LARIESMEENQICVRFKQFNILSVVDWASIQVIDDPHMDESSDESDNHSLSSLSEEEELKNEKVSFGTGMGDWEKYTKGIGSKLMAKMGYTPGKGLGRMGEGRLEPVEVVVLPQGNVSLDLVMKLREKQLLKKQKQNKKLKQQNAIKTESDIKNDDLNVFEFINQKLAKSEPSKTSDELKSPPNSSKKPRDLNVQMLETHNRIQDAERQVAKYKESLIRNKNSDKKVLDQLRQKLDASEKDLQRLKKQERDLTAEKSNRKKKSDIF
jgi:hypothetical protein